MSAVLQLMSVMFRHSIVILASLGKPEAHFGLPGMRFGYAFLYGRMDGLRGHTGD